MGVIRGILLVFVAVFLFFSLFLVTLFWTLNLSLSYDNVQRQSGVVVKDLLNDLNVTTQLQIISPLLQLYCQSNSSQNNSNYVFSTGDYVLDIPCSVALQGSDAITDAAIKNLIHSIYYAEYDCNFLDCITKSPVPLFLISQKAYDFWKDKLYFAIMTSLILLGLAFLFIEKKSNLPLLAGSLLIICSLPFFKLNALFSLFSNKIFFKFLAIFFSQESFVSLRILIIGIVLILIGIIFKVFKVGFFVSKIISKIKAAKDAGMKSIKEKMNKTDKKSADDKSK
jgi:hypothetical protein